MAISISEFRALMKQASMTPGNQAMADAAKMAMPPGGIPLPNMPKPEEQQDPNQLQQHAVQDAMKYRAELERKDKELAAARRQIQQAENTAQHARNLAEVQKREDEALLKIKEQEAQADARIRKNEMESMQRLQRQGDQPQVDYKSKEEAHQARLERDSALEKAKRALEMSAERDALTKEKAKQDMELSSARDSIAQEKAKAYADIATQNAKEYVSTTEKVRQQSDAENFTRKKHDAQLENISRGGLVQKVAAQQMPSTGAQQQQKPQSRGAQPATAVQTPSTATQTPSTAMQTPSTATQTTDLLPRPITGEEQYKRNQKWIKSQQDKRNFLSNQGKWTAQLANATDQSLKGRAIAIANAKNQLAKLKREGKTTEMKSLNQAIAGLQSDFDAYKKSIEQAAKGGDRGAKAQLAQYGDVAYRHGTASDFLDSTAEHGIFTRMWRRLRGKKNLTDYVGMSDLERIAHQDEIDQIRKDVGSYRWLDPTKSIGDIGNLLFGGVAKAVEGNAQSADMAARRGIERGWWGDAEGNRAAVNDYRRAINERGLSGSIMGNAGRIGLEGALTAATFVPFGGAGVAALRGAATAGKTALQSGLRSGIRAGWNVAKPGLTSGKSLAMTGIGIGGVGGSLALGSPENPTYKYTAPSGRSYENGQQKGLNWQGVNGVPSMYNYMPYPTNQYQPGINWNMYDPEYGGTQLWKYASVKSANQPVQAPTQRTSRPQTHVMPLSNKYGTNAIDYQRNSKQLPGVIGYALDVASPYISQYLGIDINPYMQPKMNEATRFDPLDVATKAYNYMNDENAVYRSIQNNYRNYYGYPPAYNY